MELSRDFILINQTLMKSKQTRAFLADLDHIGMIMLMLLWCEMFRQQVNINSLSAAEVCKMAALEDSQPPADFLKRIEDAGFLHRTHSGRLKWRPTFVRGINTLPDRRRR